MSDLLALIARFRVAYSKADRDGLAAAISDDFEWHMHFGDHGDAPTGKVLVGIDALMKEIEWRQGHWKSVSYADFNERAFEDLIVQTFASKGIDENDQPFHVKIVDLYPVVNKRIVRKDTYWKNVTAIAPGKGRTDTPD